MEKILVWNKAGWALLHIRKYQTPGLWIDVIKKVIRSENSLLVYD